MVLATDMAEHFTQIKEISKVVDTLSENKNAVAAIASGKQDYPEQYVS